MRPNTDAVIQRRSHPFKMSEVKPHVEINNSYIYIYISSRMNLVPHKDNPRKHFVNS